MSMMRNCKLNSQIAVKISVMRKKSGQFCEWVTRSHLNVPEPISTLAEKNIEPTLRIIDLYQQKKLFYCLQRNEKSPIIGDICRLMMLGIISFCWGFDLTTRQLPLSRARKANGKNTVTNTICNSRLWNCICCWYNGMGDLMIRCKFCLMRCSRVQGQRLPDCDNHMLSWVTSKMSEGYNGHHSLIGGQGFNS